MLLEFQLKSEPLDEELIILLGGLQLQKPGGVKVIMSHAFFENRMGRKPLTYFSLFPNFPILPISGFKIWGKIRTFLVIILSSRFSFVIFAVSEMSRTHFLMYLRYEASSICTLEYFLFNKITILSTSYSRRWYE